MSQFEQTNEFDLHMAEQKNEWFAEDGLYFFFLSLR